MYRQYKGIDLYNENIKVSIYHDQQGCPHMTHIEAIRTYTLMFAGLLTFFL